MASMYDGYICRGNILLHIELCRSRMVAQISFLVLPEGNASDRSELICNHVYMPCFCSASVVESAVLEDGIDGLDTGISHFGFFFENAIIDALEL